MTYNHNYVVWHCRYGDVVIPDQVAERPSMAWEWVPAIKVTDGAVVMISLEETDA